MNAVSRWRPHTTAITIIGLVAILVALATAFILTNFTGKTAVYIGTGTFDVRVANTPQGREHGLSGTSSLAMNEGMLFDFGESKHWGIWMKDMEIPIDIIWLDGDKRVVHIVKNADPSHGTSKTFTPEKPALYVLELASGATTQFNIKIGDRATFSLEGEE